MTISVWPADDRPREKLLKRGPDTLSDAELIAIFLRTGTRGCNAVDLARDLIQRHGGLRAVLTADLNALCRTPGIGPGKAAQLAAVVELGRRYLAERLTRDGALTSPDQAQDYLRHWLQDRAAESFCCLFLDTRHRVVRAEELFRGTIDGATVHPREVVKRALTHNAAAVIVAHNHPSGVAEPSRADEVLTRRLREALALVDIRLLDHIVVGDGAVVSLAARGLL